MISLQELRALTALVAMLRIYEVKIMQKLPLLASLPDVLNKHNFNLEARAERTHKRVALQDLRATDLDRRVGKHLDGVDAVLSSNDKYLDQVERALGGNGADTEVKKPIPTSGEGTKLSPVVVPGPVVGVETVEPVKRLPAGTPLAEPTFVLEGELKPIAEPRLLDAAEPIGPKLNHATNLPQL